MRTLVFLTIAATITIGCATAPATRQEGIEQWADRHPEASRELGEWVRVHPQAAARFFEWDGHHPEKSHDFVTWTISNPGAGLDAFVLTHRGWPVFDQIMERHRPAAEGFMQWARRHPQAAESLMSHPGGLDWAGHHVYAGYWTMVKG
jgi:hypothetical protein